MHLLMLSHGYPYLFFKYTIHFIDSSVEQKTKKKQTDMDENEMMKQQREYARATIATPQHLNTF